MIAAIALYLGVGIWSAVGVHRDARREGLYEGPAAIPPWFMIATVALAWPAYAAVRIVMRWRS